MAEISQGCEIEGPSPRERDAIRAIAEISQGCEIEGPNPRERGVIRAIAEPFHGYTEGPSLRERDAIRVIAEPFHGYTEGPSPRERDAIRAIAEPFHGYTDDSLCSYASNFLQMAGLGDDPELLTIFKNGAYLAQQPGRFEVEDLQLTPDESAALKKEKESKWNISRTLFLLVVVCGMSAVVQGMDEAVVNVAQVLYRGQFGIEEPIVAGLLNAAPYLSCALVGCWLTDPLNERFGRRGTIFITCIISSLSCLGQAFTNSAWKMFIARLALGLGIGPKSATVPVYAAESSPAAIRGALTMMWQMWVAFGIMLGFLAGVALFKVESDAIDGLAWRLIIASPMVAPLIVCAYVFFCPESPRWLINKRRFQDAFEALVSLRGTKLQAARDLLEIYASLEAEKEIRREKEKFQWWKELITVPRNWRALRASTIVMTLQQLGGVNVIVYYSSYIFLDAGFQPQEAFLASMGFGIINFLCALPAVWAIDTVGRRNLLLLTFPMMAISLLFTGLSFEIPGENARMICVCLGIFLFAAAYSPGEGPVPFVYSAECYPLYLRDIGMSWSTSVTWFFNFVVAITLPSMLAKMKPQGTFAYYAAWNVIGFFLIFFYVPETKGKTLEGLDHVFRHSTTRNSTKRIRNWLPGRRLIRKDSDDRIYLTNRPESITTNPDIK